MPDEQPDPNKPGGEPDPSIPEAARQILDEIKKNTQENPPKAPPSSQPAPDHQAIVAQREQFKKSMNFTEEQMQTYERDRLASQAPLMEELSIQKVERSHKDYEQLRGPFLAEVKNYTQRGIVINPELAEQIFYMVKGREISGGRYTQPSSQPAGGPSRGAPAAGGDSQRRIAQGYKPNDPGLGGGAGAGGGSGDDPENQLTDREKQYAGVLNVDVKDYQKMKQEKAQGIRQIADKSYRAPEIDMRTAGTADRDLAALWGKNGGKI